jgi:hypothetical protein
MKLIVSVIEPPYLINVTFIIMKAVEFYTVVPGSFVVFGFL